MIWPLLVLLASATGDPYVAEWIIRLPYEPVRALRLDNPIPPYAYPDALADASPVLQRALETQTTILIGAGQHLVCHGQ